MTDKKAIERNQIRHLIPIIQKEFGNFQLVEGEKPDFSIILPDNISFGIEVTDCCPSEKKPGKGNKEKVAWENKVRKAFYSNNYLLEQTQNNKFYLLIDTTRFFYDKRVSVNECCKEIEEHLRQILESPTKTDSPSHLIRRIRIMERRSVNTINFNHMARRDAVKASDLVKTIKTKDKKLKTYRPDVKDNCWLCIYLPWEENTHPYFINFDNNCTEEMFIEEIKKSKYKRIYVTSVFDEDIIQIKPYTHS